MNPQRIFHNSLIAILVLVAFVLPATAAQRPTGAIDLSTVQQAKILSEAQTAFDEGSSVLPADPQAAKKLFATAAEKYRLLAEGGLRNGKLEYNLANACLQSGQTGKAITGYLWARQMLGDDGCVVANLRYARSLRDAEAPAKPAVSLGDTLARWNRSLSLAVRFWIGMGAWGVFWTAWGAAVLIRRFKWRYVIVPAAIVVVLAGASVAWELSARWNHWQGVVITDNVVVRKGNGEGFAPKFVAKISDGTEFNLLERRGRWLCVQFNDGRTGWIDDDEAAVIPPREKLWQ
ncbi:MAG: hypothetical protein K8S55_10460 [Phycisphaerae bacterium]|nr:hypothetical protein [Phycisphaerae bacterium]